MVSSCLCNNRSVQPHPMWLFDRYIIIHSLLFIVIYIYMYTHMCMLCVNAGARVLWRGSERTLKLLYILFTLGFSLVAFLYYFIFVSFFFLSLYAIFYPPSLSKCAMFPFYYMYKITFSCTDSLPVIFTFTNMSKKICMFF